MFLYLKRTWIQRSYLKVLTGLFRWNKTTATNCFDKKCIYYIFVENENWHHEVTYLMPIWCWLNVGFWLHSLKTTNINISWRWYWTVINIDIRRWILTLNFGHLPSQTKCNQILTSCVPVGKVLIFKQTKTFEFLLVASYTTF